MKSFVTLAAATIAVSATILTPAPRAHADAAKPDFVKDIQPIFSTTCVQCHGADPKGKKPKGGYDMTTKEKALKTGDNKGNLVPGKSADSLMYKTLLGPVGSGDDEIGRMPYKKDPLSKEKVELIKAWIDAGAEWPDNVKIEFKE